MRRSLHSVVVAVAILAVLGACSAASPIPTPTVDPATPTPTASPALPITYAQDIDFSDLSVLAPLFDHFGGGEVEPERVEYVDLTGDGRDEAFVVVASGGTAGDLGAALIGVESGAPVVLGFVDAGGRVELRFPEVGGGVVVSQDGVYEPGDPLCCPTNLRERTFRWTPEGFELLSDQVVENQQPN